MSSAALAAAFRRRWLAPGFRERMRAALAVRLRDPLVRARWLGARDEARLRRARKGFA